MVLYQDVIDGDLCETFLALDAKRQKSIAEELDRTPGTRTKYKKITAFELALVVRWGRPM